MFETKKKVFLLWLTFFSFDFPVPMITVFECFGQTRRTAQWSRKNITEKPVREIKTKGIKGHKKGAGRTIGQTRFVVMTLSHLCPINQHLNIQPPLL